MHKMEKLNIFRRRNSQTLIDNQVITDAYTSSSIHTEDYRNFVLYLDVISTGDPTTIRFDVEFSDDNVTWYTLTDDFYGRLEYEDDQVEDGITESMTHQVQGRYVRLVGTVTGGSAGNTFTVTAKMEFHN